MPSFTTPFETLVEHCKDHDIKCRIDHGKKIISFSMGGEAAVYRVRWLITHDDEMLQMDLSFPVMASDEKMRPFVIETLVRANSKLVLGSFNLDFSDGEIVYHIATPIGEGGLDDRVIGRLFGTLMATADRYFAALMRVLFGGFTPQDSIFHAELPFHSENVSDEAKTGKAGKKPTPAPKPSSKKSARAPRQKKQPPKSRSAPTPDLPGNPPAGEGTDPAKRDRPS